MDEEFKQHITAKETWLRGLFILVFGFLLMVARIVTWAVVVLQFLFTLFSGRPNQNLLSLGRSLSHFIYQCFCYVTFSRDERPFPFADWPEGLVEDKVSQGLSSSDSVTPKKKRPARRRPRKKASVKKTAAPPAEEAPGSASESSDSSFSTDPAAPDIDPPPTSGSSPSGDRGDAPADDTGSEPPKPGQ